MTNRIRQQLIELDDTRFLLCSDRQERNLRRFKYVLIVDNS
jgi:hypothetical protein